MKSDKQKKYLVIITFEAEDDLVNIFNYTFKNHGQVQLEKYSTAIDATFLFLKNNPEAGFSRSDIHDSYKSYPVLKHVIIYRIDKEIIYIIRVLHIKMDFNYQF